jgi:murein DD-endopeptidase MepM/ murein hydrolase activator NlpD
MAFEKIIRGGAWPVTQPFGNTPWAQSCQCEWNCPARGSRGASFHAGIDLPGRRGTVVTAAGYGVVVQPPRPSGGCGGLGANAVCIRTGSYDVWYGHLQKRYVGIGATVADGTPLGELDNQGCSYGDHLHFEVQPASNAIVNGCRAVDPFAFVSRWPGTPTIAPPTPPTPVVVPPPVAAPVSAAIPVLLAGVGLLLLAERRPPRG